MTVQQLQARARRQWAPPSKQSVSEWAEENFRLSPEYSAATGKLRLYKWQRGPLDAYGDPYTRELVIMSATQMLKTLTTQVVIAHSIACDPGPILMAQPTETDAETFSKERLGPMVRDMDCLREKVSPEKKTSASNTILQKVFQGGSLSLVGAQAAGNFARRSIRLFIGDERDKWKRNIGREGDGWSLGVKRTATFRSRAKLIQVCSPTVDGDSAIAAAYERSDQRKYHIPCPHCGHKQILAWGQVRWQDGDAKTARYHCVACDQGWNDVERWGATEHTDAEWIADRPFAGVAGFWISELYSPWKTLSDIVLDFLKKKDSPEDLQTFVNTSLAETWRQKGDAPKYEILQAHAKDYTLGAVPAGVVFLTAGVDVQGDRIEVAVWGWGRGRRRYLVDYTVLEGRTNYPEVWQALTETVNVSYPTEVGVDLAICRVGIDSGHEAVRVYEWARRQGPGRVLVMKGDDRSQSPLGMPTASETTQRGKRAKYGVKVWPVGVSLLKQEIYGQIRLEMPDGATEVPAGWITIPRDGWLRPTLEEFCKQMVAEEYVTKVVKGFKKGEWVNVRPGGRNEALDTANMACAGAIHFGLHRLSDREWQRLESGLVIKARAIYEGTEPAPAPDSRKERSETRTEPAQPPPQRQIEQPAAVRSVWMSKFLG